MQRFSSFCRSVTPSLSLPSSRSPSLNLSAFLHQMGIWWIESECKLIRVDSRRQRKMRWQQCGHLVRLFHFYFDSLSFFWTHLYLTTSEIDGQLDLLYYVHFHSIINHRKFPVNKPKVFELDDREVKCAPLFLEIPSFFTCHKWKRGKLSSSGSLHQTLDSITMMTTETSTQFWQH